MRRLVPCAALVCAAFASTPSPVSAQTVDEIVAKNLEAKGGVQKLRETNTVRLSGVMTLPGGRGTTVAISKRPTSFRREVDLNGQKTVQAYDGTTMWIAPAGMPAQEMPPGPQTELLKRSVEFDAQFLDWQQKGHKIEYRGKITEAGKEFHHLVFIAKAGPPIDYFLDPETGLESKTVMTIEEAGGKGKMETRFTDYRNIDGRMIPFVMTNVLNGKQVAQIRLDRVEFNIPIDDALFKMPK